MSKTETIQTRERKEPKSAEETTAQIAKISKKLIERASKVNASAQYEHKIDTVKGVEIRKDGEIKVVQTDPYGLGKNDTVRLFNSSREEGKSTEIIADAETGRLGYGVRSVNPSEWVDIYNNPNPDPTTVRTAAAEQLASVRNDIVKAEQPNK